MEKRWRYAAGIAAFAGVLSMVPVQAWSEGAAGESAKEAPRARMGDGQTLGDTNVINDIRGSLRSLVNTALDEGSLDDVAEFLAKPDRERVAAVTDQDAPALDGQIKAFVESWKAKYQNDFDIDSQSVGAVFDYRIQHDQAQKTASVTIPAHGDLGETKLNLVNEGTITNAWRLDVPDTLSGAQLRDSLQNLFTRLNEQRDKLPSSEEEAKKLVAHKVIAAIAGSGASGAAPAAS